MAPFLLLTSVLVSAQTPYLQRPEVQAFIGRMVATHGFNRDDLNALMRRVEPLPGVLEKVLASGPKAPKDWETYRRNHVDPRRVREGVAFWRQHAKTLARAEQTYGVPAAIIVGILGVETRYGKAQGTVPTLRALATLAFDLPETPEMSARRIRFLEQLEALLLWCRDTHRDPFALSGSYAGALGIPQFLPGSIRAYAVDFDGSDTIDLQRSPADAIGSVAAFLKAHGWERGRPIYWKLPDTKPQRTAAQPLADGDPLPKHRLEDLIKAGLTPKVPRPQAVAEAEARVILVDLPTPNRPTQYGLGFPNFYAITRYNRSFFYAASVVTLSESIRRGRGR